MQDNQRIDLTEYGWNETWAERLKNVSDGQGGPDQHSSAIPGRVIAHSRGNVLAMTAAGEVWCSVSGALARSLEEQETNYCAGDWLALNPYADGSGASARALLPRKSLLARLATVKASKAQGLAANIDYVFLMMGLDGNFNPARMERFVAIAYNSGAMPVILLNKADLVDDPDAYAMRIEAVAPGVPVLPVSAESGAGVDGVRTYLRSGVTAVLIGSSGVGKSTMLNTLAGERLRAVREVRSADSRGRHTTSLRELFLLPEGGCLIDTPGVREVALWVDGQGIDDVFAEVTALAAECKFNDCAHQSEPGCAVKAALDKGTLTPERYQNYLKLKREMEFIESRENDRIRQKREQRNYQIAQFQRTLKKQRR